MDSSFELDLIAHDMKLECVHAEALPVQFTMLGDVDDILADLPELDDCATSLDSALSSQLTEVIEGEEMLHSAMNDIGSDVDILVDLEDDWLEPSSESMLARGKWDDPEMSLARSLDDEGDDEDMLMLDDDSGHSGVCDNWMWMEEEDICLEWS
jgi:hypothetical protein